MKDTRPKSNAGLGGPREAVGPSGGRAKPHSLAPVAGDVDVGEAIPAKRRPDLLPWIMGISAVAGIAAVVLVYATRNPQLYGTEVASSAVTEANADDVFEHAGYGALRWRSDAPEVASDFVTESTWEGPISMGPDLALMAASLGDAEREAASCSNQSSVEEVTLLVTFHPAGYVDAVEVKEQEQLGREATECIMYAVLIAPTPTYIGEELTIQHMFRLR